MILFNILFININAIATDILKKDFNTITSNVNIIENDVDYYNIFPIEFSIDPKNWMKQIKNNNKLNKNLINK